MLPGSGAAGLVAGAATTVGSAVGAGRAVVAAAGGVNGRARAAAQVTPIEEASNPRMRPILDRAIRIRTSGN
ncbi:hypothetical protein GCM10010251_19460 [Streptomyces aurantiogriseus]|uniref:Uncharacterized protein n=1 Tax=Streptomyces aurantiogriseus TaxID=66870 RepID=A0A918C2I9_9ACTN|nr:hypothetical protein GCM10010251_19460 [Streptomyces aurantiogriseus]